MTVSGITTVVRRFLQDTIEPYRFSSAELRKDLQFAIRELHKIRPETRYVSDETGIALVDCVELPELDDSPIDIDERFEECLAYYVTYLCYLDDSADTANATLADSYLAKFNSKAQI